MPVAAPTHTQAVDLREIARRAAAALGRYPDVVAVCLLGSVARGNALPDSDIDVLVVTEPALLRSQLLRRLPPDLRDERLSLLSSTVERWTEDVEGGSLFVHHVRLEGEVLHDPRDFLARSFEVAERRPLDVRGDIERQIRSLRLYRDLSRLNGQHLFALSHLYAIGKAVAIARCAELGKPTFVKSDALERLGHLKPELARDTQVVQRLRPFYDITHGRDGSVAPFSWQDADGEVRKAIKAIARMARD